VDLLVEKVDKQDTAVRLNGATLTLRQIDPEKEGSMDTRTLEGGRTETQTTSGEGSDEGTLTFDSLGEGYYEIKETKAPSNYILRADTAFYIRIVGHQVQLLQKDVHKSAKSWKVIAADYSFISVENATATVFNSTGAALPHTGGPGTRLFMIFGAFLIAGAGLLLLRRRRTI
jgi:LPXTG-motif cell wall-anchored protein